ncbi:hypothetical protein [Pedobacter sandarakinus]|uniref:hypothetical protein n=1 Tax=Pedobacter sandarakinus TaxID=353156 RepID=UPI0022453F08|nr:hypothetical protein [Pedobacter sandarakinus]MCX2575381.1 hypothetical protein [Pedobacter sandarakinus]
MYKIIITILLVAASLAGLGQQFPTTKSVNHQQINGTNIFMVPPFGYLPSKNFKGFQNPLDPTSMIMIVEIPGPYSKISTGFNAEMLKAKGMELKVKKETSLAGLNAMLIELDQQANGMMFSKHILIYGNEKSTTLVNGVYLKDSLENGKQIERSVLSALLDTGLKTNPGEALDYSLDEHRGNLKFKAVIGNGLIFNRDLKTPTESVDKATLITDKSFAKVDIANQKLFCISRLKKYPEDYSIITSKGISNIEIDSLKGYALFAKNNAKANEEMYQVILFKEGGGYFLFVGTYLSGSNQAIADIKKVILSFRRK